MKSQKSNKDNSVSCNLSNQFGEVAHNEAARSLTDIAHEHGNSAAEVSAREQSRKDLEQRESSYRRFFDHAKDAMYVHNMDGKFLLVNTAGEQLTGYSQTELKKMSITDLLPRDQFDICGDWKKEPNHNDHTVFEVEVITKDGRRVPVEVSNHLIYENLVTMGVLGTVRDISERRRVEEALRDSEKRYRELFENVNDMIFACDLLGNFTKLNRAGESLTGYSREEALNMKFSSLVVPQYLETAQRMLTQKMVEGTAATYQLEIITKYGDRVMVEVSARSIFSDGTLIGIQGVARDITERKRTEFERQAIFEIMQGVSATENLQELSKLIQRATGKVIYANNCFVVLCKDETTALEMQLFADKYDSAAPEGLSRTCAGQVFRTDKPFLLNKDVLDQLSQAQRSNPGLRPMIEESKRDLVGRCGQWLGVPLNTASAKLGALVVQRCEEHGVYSERDIEFLSSIAAQIAVAIERKRTKEARALIEEHLARALAQSPAVIYTMEINGQRYKGTSVTENIKTVLGYEVEEALSPDWFFEHVHPDDRIKVSAGLLPLFHQNRFVCDYRLRHKDATYRWIRDEQRLLCDAVGRPTEIVGVWLDITDQMMAGSELPAEIPVADDSGGAGLRISKQ